MTTNPLLLPTSNAASDVFMDADETRFAFLAHMRHDLLTSVEAIVGFGEALLHDTRDAPPEFSDDVRKLHTAGGELFTLVQRLLDPAALTAAGEKLPEKLALARHDIGNNLNHVVGYCQLLLLHDQIEQFGSFRADLDQIRTFCTECETKLAYYKKAAQGELGVQLGEGLGALIQQAAEVILPPSEEPTRARTEPGSILLVEDNPASRQVIARLLGHQGHVVSVAENGRVALEMLAHLPIDVVLMDILMPEMNGILALKHLKANPGLRDIPVLMMSAVDEIHSVVRCIEMGAEDYLPKPVDRILLEARLNACLEKKRLRDREALHLREIEEQKRRADELLHVILPSKIVAELKTTDSVKPQRHAHVAVLFADIVGFTPYCDQQEPEAVLARLQRLAEQWEEIAIPHRIEKIKTIGDALMAACGLLLEVENPVLNCIRCGLEMMEALKTAVPEWQVRIGIHVGPVVAGVLGRRQFLYDLWGDTVNTAARMESHGVPSKITLSRDAWACVQDQVQGEWETIKVKGKGEQCVFRLASLLTP